MSGKNRKWVKENGEEYQDEDILCIDFKTFREMINNEKHETAFSYLKKFRDETGKVKESIPRNDFVGYLDSIEMEMQNFFLSNGHL